MLRLMILPQIKILAVGKVKENYILEGMHEYLKRMKGRIEIVEIKDSTKEKESIEITRKLEKLDRFLTVALDEHGKEMTSLEFSEFIKNNFNKNLCFIVGGPDGLDKSILEGVDHTLALSRMTFTHEMARLLLVEQLYRAFSIIDGKKYHRG